MRILAKARLRLRSLFRRSAVERELEDELRFHLEQLVEEKIGAGMPAEEALDTRRATFRHVPVAAGRAVRRVHPADKRGAGSDRQPEPGARSRNSDRVRGGALHDSAGGSGAAGAEPGGVV